MMSTAWFFLKNIQNLIWKKAGNDSCGGGQTSAQNKIKILHNTYWFLNSDVSNVLGYVTL